MAESANPVQAGEQLTYTIHYANTDGARTLAYLLMWSASAAAAMTVMTMTLGLSQYRKQLLGSQTEAD